MLGFRFESEWEYNMNTTFKYNNQIITTPNLEKKLKKMKLTLEDIEIIPNEVTKEKIEEDKRVLYHFKNPKTGETIISIYPDLIGIKDKDDYVKC